MEHKALKPVPSEAATSLLKNWIYRTLSGIGNAAQLFAETIVQIFKPPFQFDLLLKQLLFIGFNSLTVVFVSGFFTGMVLGVQGYVQLKYYAVEGSVAQFVSTSIVKELGPMITAFVLSGRIGASITAELSTMKVTEQIDALEVMGTNPVKYLVVPRFLACTIMLPTLTIFSTFAGIFGGYIAVVTPLRFQRCFFYFESSRTSVCRKYLSEFNQGNFVWHGHCCGRVLQRVQHLHRRRCRRRWYSNHRLSRYLTDNYLGTGFCLKSHSV